MKAITENQLHDFLINSRHSCKKYCLHNSTLWRITITVDPRIKFGLRKGDCFVKKLSFSRVLLRWSWIFFLANRTSFVYRSSSSKTSKSLMLKVAKVLKLTLFSVKSLKSLTLAFSQIFSVKSLKSLTLAFSQIFSVTQFFFKILTIGTKGSIIPKSEGVPDVRD